MNIVTGRSVEHYVLGNSTNPAAENLPLQVILAVS